MGILTFMKKKCRLQNIFFGFVFMIVELDFSFSEWFSGRNERGGLEVSEREEDFVGNTRH